MENWHNYFGQFILQGRLPLALKPDKPLQQVATDDIGWIASVMFNYPDWWIGREIDLAGDELTGPAVAALFSRVLNINVVYEQVSLEDLRNTASEEMMKMYQWFNDTEYHVDIPALRQQFATLQTLEEFLRGQQWIRKAAEDQTKIRVRVQETVWIG